MDPGAIRSWMALPGATSLALESDLSECSHRRTTSLARGLGNEALNPCRHPASSLPCCAAWGPAQPWQARTMPLRRGSRFLSQGSTSLVGSARRSQSIACSSLCHRSNWSTGGTRARIHMHSLPSRSRSTCGHCANWNRDAHMSLLPSPKRQSDGRGRFFLLLAWLSCISASTGSHGPDRTVGPSKTLFAGHRWIVERSSPG